MTLLHWDFGGDKEIIFKIQARLSNEIAKLNGYLFSTGSNQDCAHELDNDKEQRLGRDRRNAFGWAEPWLSQLNKA